MVISRNVSLLVVDDDLELAQMLEEFLQGEGFATFHALSGERALAVLSQQQVDLVILDVMMPGLSGFKVLELLRQRSDLPVLMLTARGDDADRILGLELGADDYLSKPFNPRELAARVRAILRRLDRKLSGPEVMVRLGPLTLGPAKLAVAMDGRPVRLTAAEFMVLEALVSGSDQMQTRAALTESALGRSLEAYDRSIDTHVSNLRRKLGLSAGTTLEIRSIRGAGYMLTVGDR